MRRQQVQSAGPSSWLAWRGEMMRERRGDGPGPDPVVLASGADVFLRPCCQFAILGAMAKEFFNNRAMRKNV